MYYLESLQLENFMSFTDQTIEFDKGATMIVGRNLTDKGQKSNGSGKSAILEGISVAMTGDILRKNVTVKDLVRGEEAKLTLQLTNPFLGEDLTIERIIFSGKKSSKVVVFENNKEVESITSVADADKYILNKIGISKDDLLSYFLISSSKYKSFFDLTDKNKKEVIARFSQANLIDPVFDTVKKSISETEDQITIIDRNIANQKGKLEVFEEQFEGLEEENKQLEERRKNKLISIDQDIYKNNSQLVVMWNKYSDTEELLVTTWNAQNDFEKVDFEKEREKLKKKEEELLKEKKEINEDVESIKESKAKYNKVLLGKIECPECDHEFTPGEDISPDEAQKKINKADNLLNECAEDLVDVNERIESNTTKLTDLSNKERAQLTQLSNLDNNEATHLNTLSLMLDKIQLLNNNISQLEEQKTKVQDHVIADKGAEVQANIDKTYKKIGALAAYSLRKEHEKARQKLQLVTLGRFKTHLSNMAIGAIEYNVNEYLKEMGSDLAVEIEGFKINRDGSVRESISVSVLRGGDNLGPLGKFSGGERARIYVAGIFAIQKLILSNCPEGKGLEFTFLDEVIEALDSEGIEFIMKSLHKLNKYIYVITHGTMESVYHRVIEVKKEREISQISNTFSQ